MRSHSFSLSPQILPLRTTMIMPLRKIFCGELRKTELQKKPVSYAPIYPNPIIANLYVEGPGRLQRPLFNHGFTRNSF